MDLSIYEMIDNELSNVLYQSMNERDKRLCKRNLVKMYEELQENMDNTINTIILDTKIKFKEYNYNTFNCFIIIYVTICVLFVMALIALKCV